MRDTKNIFKSVGVVLFLIALAVTVSFAQETRSSIFGTVTDGSGGVVPGAEVTVTNVNTNAVSKVRTNESGYYEASLLLPGTYEVLAEANGFKKGIRQGLSLSIGSRAQADIQLVIGDVSESVTVTAEPPLLETSAVTAGRIIDNRSIRDLPTLNNNATLLVRLTPGVQVGNAYGYTNPAFTYLGSELSTGGNVGGNSFSIDGVQSRADRRRVAYQPHPDTIEEFKIETANFDASVGGSSGLFVSTMTKSGSNQYHGTVSWEHWESQWNAVSYFIKKNFNDNLQAALDSGDPNRIKTAQAQVLSPPQHSNNYAFSIGGPIVFPHFGEGGPALWSGKNKLFFFFNYDGLNDRMFRTGYGIRTVPTEAERQGDFSDLLALGSQYQIYDPLTTRPDPAHPGHVIRDPFPDNIIPQSRFNNPAYQAYVKLLPLPNVVRSSDPLSKFSGNYITLVPWRFDYHTWTTRVDYNPTNKLRIFGRVLYSHNLEHNQDWLYQFAPGYGEAIGLRRNRGGTLDAVYSLSSNTIVNFSGSVNEFDESNEPVKVQTVKPSSVGLPTYMDDFAAARGKFHFPQFNVSGYDTVATWGAIAHPPGVPKRYIMWTTKGDVTHIHGDHTLRAGIDSRYSYKTLTEPGTTSGSFGFSNIWTRQADNTTNAGTLGLSWAAFILGMPSNGMSVDFNDNAAAYNPYYGTYIQDNWRVSPRLTINAGLRLEYDVGVTERYNRMIGYLDKNAQLPISQLAQDAYARNSIPELAAANFKVQGGSIYVGTNGANRKLYGNDWLWNPRIGASYQLNSKTVLQAGYGIYHDVLNVMDFTASFPADNQFGYSRGTSTSVSLDNGLTWLEGDPLNGISPLTDPFPVRSDGTRFNTPVRNSLGLSAIQGLSFSYIPYDIKRARQQRWRASVQRQIGSNMVVEAAYVGTYSDHDYFNRNINFLPEQYWVGGNIRNTSNVANLTQNVPNPFYISNFAALQASNPLVYGDMQTKGYFNSKTVSKSQLLSPFPALGGLTERQSVGKQRTNALELSITRRFSQGFTFNANYTMTNGKTITFLNSFDTESTWIPSNNSRPHRVTVSGIYEFPFGKGKPFVRDGFLSKILGGWQVAGTYEWQPGPLIGFGNLFYYGDMSKLSKDIKVKDRTLDNWFNWTLFPGISRDYNSKDRSAYETRIKQIVPQTILDQMTTAGVCGSRGACTYSNVTPSDFQPGPFQRRVFPLFIDGMRADGVNYINANLQRNFNFTETTQLQFRLDVLNLLNRQSFGGPNGNGVVTGDANGPNRFLQAQVRFRF